MSRDDIIALCPAGVFDSIAEGLPRPMQARRLLAAHGGNVEKGQCDLFAAEPHPVFRAGLKSVIAPPPVTPPARTAAKSDNDLWEEYTALGFLRNNHPLALWKDLVLAVKYRVKAIHIADFIGRPVKMVGWPITQKDVWTKDGLTMSFLSLEDETAMYETVIFPQVYDKFSKLLFDQRPLLVYGKVADDNGALSVEINRIEALGQRDVGETFGLRYMDMAATG